jgi:hypothetical protein
MVEFDIPRRPLYIHKEPYTVPFGLDPMSRIRNDRMRATYTLNPNEIGAFLKVLQATCSDHSVRITIESFSDAESQEQTYARMRRALDAEKNGDFVQTMTIEELEAMAQ